MLKMALTGLALLSARRESSHWPSSRPGFLPTDVIRKRQSEKRRMPANYLTIYCT